MSSPNNGFYNSRGTKHLPSKKSLHPPRKRWSSLPNQSRRLSQNICNRLTKASNSPNSLTNQTQHKENRISKNPHLINYRRKMQNRTKAKANLHRKNLMINKSQRKKIRRHRRALPKMLLKKTWKTVSLWDCLVIANPSKHWISRKYHQQKCRLRHLRNKKVASRNRRRSKLKIPSLDLYQPARRPTRLQILRRLLLRLGKLWASLG